MPVARRIRIWLGMVGRQELIALAALLAAAAGLWGFVELAGEVIEGDTHAFDTRLLLALRDPGDPNEPIGPAWLEELMRDFTALGGVGVLTLMTAGVSGFLALQGKWRAALLVLLAIGGGLLISTLLKTGFDRPRPDLVPYGSLVHTASFPSGHSLMAGVVYLTLGALLARVQGRKRVKAFVLGASVLVTVLVGISRVYLGVHWPTDVLAGWTVGAVWAILCWLAMRALQRHGDIEIEGDEDDEIPDLP